MRSPAERRGETKAETIKEQQLKLPILQVEVYWFDDSGRGEVRVPQSWRILYRDGEAWKPVENGEPYAVERDRYNKVTFKPVTTSGLRLEIVGQPGWSVGIQEWRVK